MGNNNVTQSKGAKRSSKKEQKEQRQKESNSAVDDVITDHATIDKNSEGKFFSQNLLLISHTAIYNHKNHNLVRLTKN